VTLTVSTTARTCQAGPLAATVSTVPPLRQQQKPARGHGENRDSNPKGDAQHGCQQCGLP
jgi:hypothetical protein